MTELKDICVSLETAKALVDAGIKIDSCAYWIIDHDNLTTLTIPCPALLENWKNKEHYCPDWIICPAPTFEELDPIDLIVQNCKGYKLRIRKSLNHWIVSYNNFTDQNDTITDPEYHFINEHSLVETMAEVMIQLKMKEQK